MTLKALILVGGYGTRLRPLTLNAPKPLVPFGNKAIVMHQIEALAETGVKEIILAVSYRSDVMKTYLEEKAKHLGITITLSKEDEPLGTAGPLALAKERLSGGDPFFVLNSDVICEFPFGDMLDFHRRHGKEGTIFVTRVEDPSKYGVVVSGEDGKIHSFVEKPVEFVGDCINAGLYIFNPSVLDRIKPVPTSIEREVFPRMAEDGELYSMVLPGMWMDIGQPPDYLRGLKMYLKYIAESDYENEDNEIASGKGIVGTVLVIGANCLIGPDVVIGPGVVIDDCVRLQSCAVFSNVHVKSSASIDSSIVGNDCIIGRWARLQDCTVLGDDVQVKQGVMLNGVKVLPHKTVKEDELSPRVIM